MGVTDNAEATFIARMTASTTHELRNVLAVVKESAGLVEDLTLASRQGKSVDPERLLQATRRIDAQVGRGAELLTSLNRLAHGLDHPVEPLALGPLARQVVFLCQRFARQRRQRLEVEAGGDAPALHANALGVQMMMVAAIDCCLEQWPDECLIKLTVDDAARPPTLSLDGTAGDSAPLPAPDGARGWPRLLDLTEQQGARVTTGAGRGGIRLEFTSESAE